MDRLFVNGLAIETIIGAYAWERQLKQQVLLDLEFAVDMTKAAESDSLSDALDYDQLCRQITEFVQQSQFQLIEALGHAVADFIVAKGVPHLRLTLYKPRAVKTANNVGVIICRGDYH